MNDRVRLIAEKGLLYAPHYVAEQLGMFDAEGLNLDTSFESGPGGSWLADVLAAGEADIARGGIWIPLTYRHRLERLTIIAVICHRNPQVLLTREAITSFDWKQLRGKKVLLPAAATSQWMFLEGLLIEQGVDIGGIRFLRDLAIGTTTRLWRAGLGDFYLVSPPLSEVLLEEGYALATTLASSGGAVPWSVYYTTPEFAARSDRTVVRFLRALLHAQRWVVSHAAAEVAAIVRGSFMEYRLDPLTTAIARMQREGVWLPSVQLDRGAFVRYQRIIQRYGLIDRLMPFPELVAESLAADLELSMPQNVGK